MNIKDSERLCKELLPLLSRYKGVEEFDDFIPTDSESRFLNEQHTEIAEIAQSLSAMIKYTLSPVKLQGRLSKNSQGRYEIENTGEYFTSGSPIEIWDEDHQSFRLTRIEHRGDYYAVCSPDIALEGTLARIR